MALLSQRTVLGKGTKSFPHRSTVCVTKGILKPHTTGKGITGRVTGVEKRGPVVVGMLVNFGRGKGNTVVKQSELKRCPAKPKARPKARTRR